LICLKGGGEGERHAKKMKEFVDKRGNKEEGEGRLEQERK